MGKIVFVTNLYQQEAEFALEVVREGALLARQIRMDYGDVHVHKHDRSPVTLADHGVQALISGRLESVYPEDPLVAEEEASTLNEDLSGSRLTEYLQPYWPNVTDAQIAKWIVRGESRATSPGRFWTLDPVDGTKGYIRGGQYAVVLALIEDGEVVLGALGCPGFGAEGSAALAIRSIGAWHEPLTGGERTKLLVSQVNQSDQARLIQSVEPSHTNLAITEQIRSDLGVEADPQKMDSQAKYLMLASGKVDMMFRLTPAANPAFRSMIWDQAAGCLLVEEAGGKVTDLDGRNLDFSTGAQLVNNRGVLATNGKLHDVGLDAIRQGKA